MKNETIDPKIEILQKACDLHPYDFDKVLSTMIFLKLEDKPEDEGEISYNIITDELLGVHDRADNFEPVAFEHAGEDWAKLKNAIIYAEHIQFGEGSATFGKSDLLAMLANAIMDIDAPMSGRVHRGDNQKPFPVDAAAVAYLESL